MTIMGLDISPYQENPLYNQFIDWIKLKADPLNFRFIWIKCSEGIDSTGYNTDATRQVTGAKSVKFEAINPYHYYLFQWFSTLANRWYQLSALDQANAFYAASGACNFSTRQPMTDCEDPFIDQFLHWSDTATANAAIAFARRLNAHLKSYHQYIENIFKIRPAIYTGKWWLDKWVPLLISNGYGAEVAWLKDYDIILADYDGTLNIPDYIDVSRVIAWQKDSTPVPPVQGIPTGHIVAGDALDIDQWLLSDEEFAKWSGGEVMTTIYNTKVPQTQRAKILTLRGDQKLAVPVAELHIDAVILPMGTMHNWIDNSHWQTKTESTFAGRCDLFRGAGIPVIGKFDLDAGSLIAEQHGLDEFKNRTIKDNFILPFLINAWHIGNWTWDTIFAKQGQFRKLNAIIISEAEITPWVETYPNGEWNQVIWDYVVDHLRTLMANEQVPTVPILMYTGGWWLLNYPKEMNDIELQNNKSWLYLHLAKWVNYSTATFNTLDELFAFRPAESFDFKIKDTDGNTIWDVPTGYNERVLMHEFTGEAQKVKQITDINGVPTPVNLSLWNDTKEALNSFLALPTTTPSTSQSLSPSASPSQSDTELEERVELLETKFTDLLSIINDLSNLAAEQGTLLSKLTDKLNKLEAWKNAPL